MRCFTSGVIGLIPISLNEIALRIFVPYAECYSMQHVLLNSLAQGLPFLGGVGLHR
jgi:hypothetical protein